MPAGLPKALVLTQKQRAGIARALVNRPRVILADEPTASLDKQSGRDVVELIQELAREDGAAVVLVTHDNRILDVADRILHLEDGHMRSLTEAVSEALAKQAGVKSIFSHHISVTILCVCPVSASCQQNKFK